jgi:hypothetical protein
VGAVDGLGSARHNVAVEIIAISGQTVGIASAEWFGYFAAVAVVASLIFLVLMIRSDVRRVNSVRSEHLGNRQSLSDEEFVRQVGVGPEMAHVALGVRNGFASAMRVPADTVFPSDDLVYASGFESCDLSWYEIACEIEKVLGVRIRGKLDYMASKPRKPGQITFRDTFTVADIARRVVEKWNGLPPLTEHERKELE